MIKTIPSISIIKPMKAPEPKNGDILTGNEFLWELLTEKEVQDVRAYHLSSVRSNHWKALERFGLKANDLQEESRYECPFDSGNSFFRIYPIAISEPYIHEVNEISRYIMERDPKSDFIYTELYINNVDKSFMGHGYCQGITPHDGHGRWKWAKIRLSDERWLFAIYWEWYNK